MAHPARFKGLDSLRGLAALVVVLHHLMLSLPDGLRDDLRYIALPLNMGGRFAVILFFVLSGFVLALPYFAGTNSAYAPYLVRRFCRLYPPFAFAVLVSALLCHLLGGPSLPMVSDWLKQPWSSPVTSVVVVSHLLMVGIGWDRSIGLDGSIWSLIIEMRVSIMFPLLVLYVRRFGWSGVAAALVASFVCTNARVALGEVNALVAESPIGALLLTGHFVALFLLGVIVAARLDQIKELFCRVSPKLHGVVFIGMVFIWMMLAYYMKERTAHLGGYADVFCGVFTMYLIGLCVTFPKVSAKLSGRVCLWLGDISYSLYLIHLPVLLAVVYLLNGRMSLGGMFAVAFPAMLLAGHVMHHLIELPSMKLGRKLAGAIRYKRSLSQRFKLGSE
jgi:peptidoglycan/LPS O-acetylase OafA/YrhL